jgi:hypothetical protein
MTRKELAIIAALGFLVIIQVSFAPYLALPVKWLSWLNLVDLAVAVVVLFEKRRHNMGWAAAFWGGIFLDLYSTRFFGFWIMVLLAMVAFVKLVLKKYVRIPSFW